MRADRSFWLRTKSAYLSRISVMVGVMMSEQISSNPDFIDDNKFSFKDRKLESMALVSSST